MVGGWTGAAVAYAIAGDDSNLAVARGKLGDHLGEGAQLCSADGREVPRMRAQHPPASTWAICKCVRVQFVGDCARVTRAEGM